MGWSSLKDVNLVNLFSKLPWNSLIGRSVHIYMLLLLLAMPSAQQ